jgi:hypothetical protein
MVRTCVCPSMVAAMRGEEMMGLTRRFARVRRREHATTKMVGGKEAVRDVCIGFQREAY